MATIQATVVQTGSPTASKTFTLADTDMDKAVVAYQAAADKVVGSPATRNQVLSYMFDQLIKVQLQAAVRRSETIPPVVPPPIDIT